MGKFYDHTVPGYIWGQNLIYALYADEKTTYPLGFRLYEKDAKRRVELTIELVNDLIEIGVPADTYLFDISYCSEECVTHLEGYGKEWFPRSRVTRASRTVENASVSTRLASASTRFPGRLTATPTISGRRSVKLGASVQ
ncbi:MULTISPECIES: hypothetical protein [Halomicrobium]|uniref:hypothetical protein n=1 Tax=Halomicrobium TaxID=203135 RepID=UPI000677B224|nr:MULTISPECIES: hypothetical protein [Halomicrobium]